MEKKKRKDYTEAELASALLSIDQGVSIYQASRNFKIPETTLRNKRDGIYSNDICGVQPVLNVEEENLVVDWIHYLGKCGFPVSKEQLLDTVAVLVKSLKRPNPFKDGRPGKTWFQGFLKRHPTVAKRVAQNLPMCRNQITEDSIRAWFERVHTYLEKNDLLQVFSDSRRIFNCDETAFFLSPKEKEVLVQKGSKRVYNRVANDEKECLTVLVNVSANGDVAPPMVLYPYKKAIPKNIKSSVPGWWGLGNTESGWMTMESFYEYVANVFYPWLIEKEVPLPVALFLDGHTSHISLPLTTFCKEKKIVLIALLPNATHVLQPLDVAVFRPVKGTWRDIVHEFRVNNNYRKLKRTDFAKEVQKCFDRCLKAETIKNGFECCGIFPFDQNNINYEKLLSKTKNTPSVNSTTKNNTDQNNEVQVAICMDEDEEFKKKFEDRLSPNTLRRFKDADGHWNGDPTYEKLFLYWFKITTGNRDCHENSIELELGETTLTNNVDRENISEAIFNLELRSNGVLTLCSVEEIGNQDQAVATTSRAGQDPTPLGLILPPTCIPKPLTMATLGSKEQTLLSLSTVSPKVLNTVELGCITPAIVPLSASSMASFPPDAVVLSIDDDKLDEVIMDKARLELELPDSLNSRFLSDKLAFQHLRASTPKSSNCDSPQFSLSEVEDDTFSTIEKSKKTQNLILAPIQTPTRFQTNTGTLVSPEKRTLSPQQYPKGTTSVPTPFKHVSTPFKHAFYFPKADNNDPKKKIVKKVTPTVATANEFIEHQRRIEKEKEDKEKLKQKRKLDAIEKRKEKENIKRQKKTQALQKNKTKKISKTRVSLIAKPGISLQKSPAVKDNDELNKRNSSLEMEFGSDDGSRDTNCTLSANTLIMNNARRRCFLDTDSDSSV